MDKSKGFFSLLAAGFIFGTFGVWVRILNNELTDFQQILFRNIVGFLLATLVIYVFKRKVKFKNVSYLNLFLFTISLPVTIILYTLAILKTKIIVAVASLYLGSIIFSLLLGIIFFKEKVTAVKIAAIILAVAGLFFFAWPLSLTTINIGLVFGVLSGFTDTASNSFKKHLSGKVDRFMLIAIQMFGGIVISLGLMVYTNTATFPQISFLTFAVGVVFGILLMLINYFLLVGFSNFDLNLGTIVLSSELVFASIIGFFAFKEVPSTNELIAVSLIAVSIILANLNFKKK